MNAVVRYALVGLGGRARLFIDAITGPYAQHAQLVAFCDLSQTRMNWHNRRLCNEVGCDPIPAYPADEFQAMVRERHPDVIIVCTPDHTHHHYITWAMRLGCDVICEKPMTMDVDKATRILAAMRETGRKLRITFNYRYMPLATKVRELVRDGAVGRPLAVCFNWLLDTQHGADYFRRWHREKSKSGGLLVHKATHHFDLVNWWIGSTPHTVFAMGGLNFYGRENAIARGDGRLARYPRYTGVPEAASDPFALLLDGREGGTELRAAHPGGLRGLYYEAEAETGYIRDRNVFDANIDIEDTMSVLVRYKSGVTLNYSLIAYCPWEGFQLSITGDRGRIDVTQREGGHIITGQSDGELAEAQAKQAHHAIVLHRMFRPAEEIAIPTATGGHGGGDPVMLEQIFSPRAVPDPFNRAASYIDGAASIAVGISANESLRTGLPVTCDTVLPIA